MSGHLVAMGGSGGEFGSLRTVLAQDLLYARTMLELGEAEERTLRTTGEANLLAQAVRAGRQHLSRMHHNKGWAWALAPRAPSTTQEQRVEAERISAALTELARSALANGCDLLPHESMPGDPDLERR